MILVLILSAANQEWLAALFHLAVLTLLQLLAVWANRRWAASRAARAQNDPAKLVKHGHYTPCPKGQKLMSLVLRILLGRACIWIFRGFVCSLARWSGRSEGPRGGPRNAAPVDLTVECLNAGVARGSAHSYMIYHKHVKSILLRLAASC